ncbi:MAG: tRNA pseudouridine(38-40) synthase TruA [Rhizobiaceae bacterium]|nr:tRNA pseudouridine(38-40) synthase TruA [Rhizobiaceae bacterium]
MPRYRLTVEYDGTPYVGWQRQVNGWSVQGALETAAASVASHPVTLFGAGRTDTGVHATMQVAHLDLAKAFPARTVMEAVNARLRMAGESISILACAMVDETFDARFSAKARHYRYLILNRRGHPALDERRAWWIKKPLQVEAMHEAAQRLLGTHDFTTFRSTECQAESAVRTLDRLDVTRLAGGDDVNGHLIEIRASARSFLHNQVRSLAGSLKLVGDGRWTGDDLVAALEARDRTACGPVAPPHALTLVGVDY